MRIFETLDDEQIDDDLPLSPEAAQTTWYLYGALIVLMTWVYWEVLRFTASYWDEGLYSHGWIVPVLAMWLALSRSQTNPAVDSRVIGGAAVVIGILFVLATMMAPRGDGVVDEAVRWAGWFPPLAVAIIVGVFFYSLRNVTMYQVLSRDRWVGVGVVVASLAFWLWCSRIDANPGNRMSYIGVLLGVTLLAGGMKLFRWAGPAVVFLVFMFPLPSVIERGGLLFLQRLAAAASTWSLQLLGLMATRDGNRLIVNGLAEPLEVADACSGLRMLTIFGAMSVAVAMTMDRPWWDRLVVVISAVPIALVTNIIRIVATALLFWWLGQDNELVSRLIHDWAGLVMMPIALGFLWLEYEVLTRLSVPIDADADYGEGAYGMSAGAT